jgi:hypothetical protein
MWDIQSLAVKYVTQRAISQLSVTLQNVVLFFILDEISVAASNL